jgi:RHS repeat-associated protein
MFAAAIRVCVTHVFRVRFSVKPPRFSKLARFVPFAIAVAFYAAVLCMPGQAVAQTCGNGTFCTGPVASPTEQYQVCDGGISCGIGTDEQSAIAAWQANAAKQAGYGACSSSYVDQTPGWQPPGIGNSHYGSYPGYANATPSFEVIYTYSTEVSQIQNPLVFTVIYGRGCTDVRTTYAYVERFRPGVTCPAGFYGFGETPANAYCWQSPGTIEPAKNLGAMCPAATKAGGGSLSSSATSVSKGGCIGDPVNPATHNNVQVETDYIGSGPMPLGFVRYYNSLLWSGTAAPTGTNSSSVGFWSTLGPNWRSSYDRYIGFTPSAVYATATAYRPDGKTLAFAQQSNGQFVPEADVGDRLVQLTDSSGVITGWQYTNAANDEIETYSAGGQLASLTSRSGLTQILSYNPGGQLTTVTDSFGRTLTFAYDSSGRLATLTDPAGGVYTYSYTSVNDVASVTYPDNSVRTYVYNESANTSNQNQPYLLTGVIDENSTRFATFQYNSDAQVISVNRAGVEHYGLTYNGQTQSTVTDPLGTSRTFGFQIVNGMVRSSSVNKTCLTDCAGFGAATTYDANGNIATTTDFNGNVTHYAYDLTRDLETSRTEAYGTARARTIATSWNSNFRLPATIAIYAGGTASGTPINTTTLSYDSSGNLLTKTVTDTTVTPNTSRTWTYTYDSYGRVLTADGPRTDVSDITTYTYYTCTTGNECGELHTVTDAAGHVTTYNTYNAHGQPLTITDPNGVLTTLTYDARQRLTSRTTAGERTSISYYPTGLVQTVTLPDGSYVAYTYDAAHRLTQITDGAGNKVVYTLDAMGNHTAENTYDPSSILHHTHSRVINALNEVSQEINAAGTAAVTTSFAYDNNGNQTAIQAPLSRNTSEAYDELNRLSQITDPANGVTKFSYDANDNLTQVTDPRTLSTSYGYNGFRDLVSQVSPDTGTTANTYDSAGNLATSTDARGAVTTYGYDALNRVTSVAYSLGGATDQTLAFTYDVGTDDKGHLTGASDANHALSWSYDPLGRVISKSQTVASVTKSVGYAYSAGDLTTLTTPSGQTVTYGYNGNHQVTSMSVNGTTVLNGATYEPLGPVSGWTWGNSTTVTRSYDGDGNITQISSNGLQTLSYDNASRISGITNTAAGSSNWTYGYDTLDRLTSGGNGTISRGWTYDANGNRLTEAGTSPSTYSISATSNQITGITGALARTYAYDAAGHTTGYAGMTATYNNAGRLQTVTNGSVTETLVYNALGQRIATSGGPAGTVLYWYDEQGHLLGEYDASGTLIEETVWLGDIPVATLRPSGSGVAIYYVHTDQLNTPRQVTRPADNAQLWTWFSDPFGTDAANANPAAAGTFGYNLRFPGQTFDGQVGLHSNGARDYDPAVGRYIESDPLGLDGGSSSLYGYADGDPISAIDPTGESAFKIIELCAKGYKVLKEVNFKQAVQAVRRGENVLTDSTKLSRRVAKAASDAKKPIRDPAHQDGYMKHYHPNPRTGGHVFYSIASALTLSHYVHCDDCIESKLATVGDFFNPLSAPKDVIDTVDILTGSE